MGEMIMAPGLRAADQQNATARQLEIPEQVCRLAELNEVLATRIASLEERLIGVSRPLESERSEKDPRHTTAGIPAPATSLGDALCKQVCHLRAAIEQVEQIMARLEV